MPTGDHPVIDDDLGGLSIPSHQNMFILRQTKRLDTKTGSNYQMKIITRDDTVTFWVLKTLFSWLQYAKIKHFNQLNSVLWRKKQNPHCGKCGSQEVIKRGSRRGINRYFCKSCQSSFSVDYGQKDEPLWIPHIDGIPFRKLGDEHNLSGKQVYQKVFQELKLLPDNFKLTQDYCEYSSGILIIDGKYIKVRWFKQKIPFLYGIDYESHDILFGLLTPAEDEKTFLEFFKKLKLLNYPLQIVVADDRSALPLALKQVYPEVPLQLCQNHYLENIRKVLHLRTDYTHSHFFNSLKKHIFDEYENDEKLTEALQHVLKNRCENILLRKMIVQNISERRKELFAYKNIFNCPNNTNLIELFNSHFNARIKSLKGFKTKEHADLWLNGLVIRRRTKPFTDCGPKFKDLNGKTSLELVLKKQTKWPEILGVKAPKR